jgi:hypothetical protein
LLNAGAAAASSREYIAAGGPAPGPRAACAVAGANAEWSTDMALFHCCDERRLDVLRLAGTANAIDFLEVLDQAAPPGVPRQRTLLVRLLRPVPATLSRDNLAIGGGERIRRIGIVWAAAADNLPAVAEAGLVDGIAVAERPRTLVVRTDSEGDFSRYTFALVAAIGATAPPAGFDPVLSSIGFSFKVECPSEFDCAEQRPCPPEPRALPPIDYLAKDYPTLRRLMLDRLSLTVPGWTERSPADVGLTLVELLAYAADQLSYRQDAVANEAYLATARRRTSVRRHARLVDYRLHEGCNARAWVHIAVAGTPTVRVAAGTPLVAEPAQGALRQPLPRVLLRGSAHELALVESGAAWFEAAQDKLLRPELNEMHFYAWGQLGCCLARGSTSATLRDHLPVAVGDVLVLQETRSPTTFDEDDADPAHRWAVRLTRVVQDADPSGGLFEPTPNGDPLPVTRIEWDAADALPFALCLGVAERPELTISVALGNIVLADHGRTLARETLPTVSDELRRYAPQPRRADRCEQPLQARVPVRYRPQLAQGPLTWGFDLAALTAALPSPEPAAPPMWPASQLLDLPVRAAMPRITLASTSPAGVAATWLPQADLLASAAGDPHFVVETEHDRSSTLRFGDDQAGQRPNPGTAFGADYRIGNGAAGNVGAGALVHLVLDGALYADAPGSLPDASSFIAIANPLPAAGGVEPEDVDAARRDAPEAFRTQERAVTPADYAEVAQRSGEVQRAAATFRWTGSWHTVFVSADRPGNGGTEAEVDAGFERRLRRHLERFRMAGYDLEVDGPRYVALNVELHLCVAEGHFRADVLRAVKQVLSTQRMASGERGLFHPDNFSFGDPVFLSRIVAAVQAVPGVASVRVDKFERLFGASPTSLADGVIRMGRLEIAQLANSPNFRERGRLALSAGGGL